MAKKIFTDESLATFIDEIKSFINNALSKKANTSHTHSISNVTNLQSTLDGKAASSHNHAASNITSGTLSSDRLPTVPISKGGTGATTASGALTNLGITATASELNYVDGVTSNIQTQLNNKAASSHTHSYLPLNGGNLTGTLGIGNKYELSPAYNYTNGCLINIGAAKSSTMVAIHITGNSYNASTLPINSLFQFYDYGDGIIMNCSGVNLGLPLGAMTVYRYNNRLYAHIKQTASYQTLSFTLLTNKSGLSPTVENAAAHTSGYTDLVTITPKNVSFDGHTHNYAGSSSAGGAANSAVKATQDASGNVITSTYATKTELDTAKSTLQTSINGKANSSHTHTIANITNLQTTLDGKAASSHNHAASNITSGTLSSDRLPTVPIAKGGTGATTAAAALTNLGAASMEYAKKVGAPYNHLVNSDFTNPILYKQSSGGTVAAWGGQTINRWYASSSGATWTLYGASIGLTGTIYQNVNSPQKLSGKTVTFAAKIAGQVLCCSGTVTLNSAWARLAKLDSGGNIVEITAQSNNELWVSITGVSSAIVEWAALYEGTYTADTLPEYQRKGYDIEQVLCNGINGFHAYNFTIGSSTAVLNAIKNVWSNIEWGSFIISLNISGNLHYLVGGKHSESYGVCVDHWYGNSSTYRYRLTAGTWYEEAV